MSVPIHGKLWTYDGHHCRCPSCRAAKSRYAKEYRRRFKESGRDLPSTTPHGSLGGYARYGCRCPECCAAASQYQREYRERAKARTS